MSAQRETVVPRAPSNRAFYNKMRDWGWKETKKNGSWFTMAHPLTGEKVNVRQPTQHEANPSSTFIEVYPEKFWSGPSSSYLHTLEKRAERKEAERAGLREGDKVTLATPAPHLVGVSTRFDAPKVTPPATAPKTTERGGNRVGTRTGNVTREEVLRVMNLLPAKMWTRPEILAVLESEGRVVEDRTKDLTDIANRVMALINGKIVTRLNRGEYWLTAHVPDHLRVEAVVANAFKAAMKADPTPEMLTVIEDRPASTIVTTEEPTMPAPVPAPATPASVEASIDDTIEAVLDLLLPDGFKASHLRYIAPWVEATKQMVTHVTGGG
jgi:hypothetical protein